MRRPDAISTATPEGKRRTARAVRLAFILDALPADEREVKVAIGRLLGAAVVALGVVSLVGWALEREELARLYVSPATLKVNTALCLVALGAATMLRASPRQKLRTLLESAAWIVAVATIFEHVKGTSLGIDELVFDDPFATTGAADGKMVLGTAIALALTATGMLGLDSLRRWVRIAAIGPLLVGGAIGFIALVGHAARLDALYWDNDVTSMALHTAASLVLLVASTLMLAPSEGLVALVMRPTPGGRLLRRLIPASLLVQVAFVVPIGWGTAAGYFALGVPMLLFWIGTMLALLPFLFWTARSLDFAEARARADAERFESVLRAATEHSIVGTDTAGTITVFNEGAERMLGYRAEEMVGRETPILIHDPRELSARAAELGVEPGFEVLAGAARRRVAETREWTYVRKDGGRVPVSLTVTSMQRADGSPSGFIGMAFDLTAQKELERELKRQAEFTGTLVGSAPVGIYATDARGGCVFVNAKWQELAGLSKDEALGDGWLAAIHPEDAAYIASAWNAFTLGGMPFAIEYRFRRPDGSTVWIAGRAVALRGERDEVVGYLGTTLEVTERRAAEAQRERLLAQSRAVLDATTDAILMTDLDGEVLFSNTAMHSFWEDVGLGGGGSIWERIARLARRTTSPVEYQRLLEAVATHPEREHVGEFTIAASGRSFVGRTAPVYRADRTLMGRIFSLRETTTERAAARAKEEFIATVSHELRTPLAAITGYTELLEDEVAAVGGESAQFLAVVQRNAQRLTQLVDDLLLLQQSETDGVTVQLVDVELGEVVRQSIERVEPAANRKSIEIDTDGEETLVVEGDAMRLGQVVDNLLSNAVKFTPEGGQRDRQARSGRTASCLLEVEDSGPGIPPDERGRLFERFFRSRDAVSRSIPGTGLGLVVSRRIAEAHGGALELVERQRRGDDLPAAPSRAGSRSRQLRRVSSRRAEAPMPSE